jgi:hypothetical protein
MSPFIKQMMEELDQTEEEITQAWTDSKKITADTFGIQESEFTAREIAYTKELVRDKFGLKHEISVTDFINSDKSARDFIEEAITTSGQMGIDRAVTHKEEPYEECDENSPNYDEEECTKRQEETEDSEETIEENETEEEIVEETEEEITEE